MNALPNRDENDVRARIETLGREVYGDDYEHFLATPRLSLDGDTPGMLIERGDFEPVLQVLIGALDGNFG